MSSYVPNEMSGIGRKFLFLSFLRVLQMFGEVLFLYLTVIFDFQSSLLTFVMAVDKKISP